MEPLMVMSGYAIAFVMAKYPQESRMYSQQETVFALADMIVDELTKKNIDIFVKPYFDSFANVKDISIGDKVRANM